MDIKGFLIENVETLENKKVVISNRFKDENGKPIEWVLKPLTAEENEDLEKMCYYDQPVTGRKGQYTRELDRHKYASLLLSNCVVYPCLDNAQLQDSYKVKTPQALLKKMLTFTEYNKLAEEVASINNQSLTDLVDDAKN